MLIQNPREFLRHAYEQHFAMPAFNVCNMEMAKAVIEAAVIEKAPVIVQTYPGDLAHAAFGNDVANWAAAPLAPTSLPAISRGRRALASAATMVRSRSGWARKSMAVARCTYWPTTSAGSSAAM